jgi:hypothetical protein
MLPTTASQAPRCRDLSPYVTQVLTTCPTSILIYPPDNNNTALGYVEDPHRGLGFEGFGV